MNDSELNIYRAIKAPVRTKLEEILKLLKKDDLLSLLRALALSDAAKRIKISW